MSVPGRGIFCCKITSKEALVIIFNFCYTFLKKVRISLLALVMLVTEN